MISLKEVSKILTDERIKSGESYETVAIESELSSISYYNLENGKSSRPSFDVVQKSLDHFGYELKLEKKK